MKRCKRTIWKALTVFAICFMVGFAWLFIPTVTLNAAAEETSIETSDLIKASLEFDTEYTYTASDENDYTGIRFGGESIHTINGVFKNTATIEYTNTYKWSGMAFGICDTDGNELVTFIRNQANQWILSSYAYYNGIYSYIDGDIPATTTEKWASYLDLPHDEYAMYVTPQSESGTGAVTFALEGSNFKISVTNEHGGMYTVADFTLNQEDAAVLANGFTLTLRGLYGTRASDVAPANLGINVLVTKINGVSVGEKNLSATVVGNDIWYDGEIAIDGKNIIKTPCGMDLKDFSYLDVCAVGSLTQIKKIAEIIHYSEDFSQKEEGSYTITVEKGNTSKEYEVIVLPSEGLDNVIVAESGTVVKEYVYENYKGISLGGNANIKVAGVFTDSATIEYAITYKWTGVAFGICDTEGNELITFVRNQANVYILSSYAYYNGMYSYINGDIPATTTEKWASYLDLPHDEYAMYVAPQSEAGTGAVTFTLVNGNFKISVSNSQGGIYTVADFVLTQSDATALAKGFTLTIRELDETKSSDIAPALPGISVLVTKINGVALDSESISCSYLLNEVSYKGFSQNETIYLAKNNPLLAVEAKATKKYGENWIGTESSTVELQWGSEYDVSQVGTYEVEAYHNNSDEIFTYTLVVEDSYKITFDVNGGDSMDAVYYSANTWDFEIPNPTRAHYTFDGWYVEDQLFTGMTAAMDEDLTLKAKWIDNTPPIISLNNIEAVTRLSGVDSLPIVKTDVTAIDGVQGDLTEDSITIFIKAPNTNEYVEYGDFEFITNIYGSYTVKYVATDEGGNQASVERSIYYTPTIPTLTLDGEVVLNYYVGQTILLPSASASSDGAGLPVAVSVMFENAEVVLENNAFVPSKPGDYEVLYSAEDSYEQVAFKRFIICVKKDDVAPTIQVDFSIEKILLGEELKLPTATATDNVEQALTVSVQVFKGTQLVSKQSFTPTETGVYSVIYLCKDSAGNECMLEYQVTVDGNENIADDGSDSPRTGCSSVISGINVVGYVGIIATIMLLNSIKKFRKKEN